jgi:SAM-dependent methyltransferase
VRWTCRPSLPLADGPDEAVACTTAPLRSLPVDALPDFDLRAFYDDYPRIEDRLETALDESLGPRGPELLFEVVRGMGLPSGSRVIDVGCGEGDHTLRLATDLGFSVLGIDPVARHVQIAQEKLELRARDSSDLRTRVAFVAGAADALPADGESTDLVWCRDVLGHVAALPVADQEFRRVLRSGGRVLVYQMFATDLLEPREAAWLFATMGVVPTSADPQVTESAIAEAGVHGETCLELGTEWGEFAEETSGKAGRQLLHAARLLRDPDRYRYRFGDTAVDIKLGDCLWHVYRMIGKLSPRLYVLAGS